MTPYQIRDTKEAMADPHASKGPPKDALLIALIGVALIIAAAIPIADAFRANDFVGLITEMVGWGLLGLIGLGLLFVARRRSIRP